MTAQADALMGIFELKRATDSVILGWPNPVMAPNARTHWGKKATAVKLYRKECWARATSAKLAADWEGPIHLWLTFVPPDRRKRDDDNLIASFKAGRDGLADALGIDDARFITHASISKEVGGMVLVRLTKK